MWIKPTDFHRNKFSNVGQVWFKFCVTKCWLQVAVNISCNYLLILIFLSQHINMQGYEFCIMEGLNDQSILEVRAILLKSAETSIRPAKTLLLILLVELCLETDGCRQFAFMTMAELVTVVHNMSSSSPYQTYLLSKSTYFSCLLSLLSVSFWTTLFNPYVHKTDILGDHVGKTVLLALFVYQPSSGQYGYIDINIKNIYYQLS